MAEKCQGEKSSSGPSQSAQNINDESGQNVIDADDGDNV